MEHTPLTEKRGEPRYATRIPCLVDTILRPHSAFINNISASGLQLITGFPLLQALMPNRAPSSMRQRMPQCEIHFKVGVAGISLGVDIRCQILYCRRLPRQRFAIGCQFVTFFGDSSNNLHQYLLQIAADS